MRKLKICLLCFLFVVSAMAGTADVGRAKDRKVQKKENGVCAKTDVLSYADRLRYNYFFLEAVRRQNMGHYASAYDILSRCVDLDSCAAEPHYMQGMLLSLMRRDTLALQSLERAAALSPDNETYQEKVAQYYIGMGNYAKGTEVYERLAASKPERSDVVNVLVQLYQQQKDYDKMLDAIDRLEQIEGEDERFAMARLSVFELKGDTKNAYNTLKDLADGHINDVTYSVMLGNWLMHNGRQKEAGKLFEEALKRDAESAYAQSSIYDYYRASGQNELAAEMMERILLGKNTPSENRMQFLRQAIQENEQRGGDSTQIIALIDRMQKVLPKDADVAEMKAAYFTLKKMPQEKINKALVELLSLAPDNSGARFQLVQNKWAKEEWGEVARLSEPGMLYNPDEMAFYYFAGLARYYQKDDKGALDAFQKGTAVINAKSDPNIVSDFYAIMGDIYHAHGEKMKAYAAFDSCLQWKPDHIMTLNNYAYYLSIEGGDLKRAEEMSGKAVKAEPKNATYLDTYAWILYCQERYTEAKIYIEQALRNDTDSTFSADVLEHAGDIYIKVGDTGKAMEMWQRAVEAGGDKAALTRKMKRYTKKR